MPDPFIGQIMLFGGNFAPRGWAFCQGQLLAIAQNTALFSILGTTYGGDGRTTFALPDLRGRVAVDSGQGPGLSAYPLGSHGGAEAVTLSTAQLPEHAHTMKPACDDTDQNTGAPQGNYYGADPSGLPGGTYNNAHDATMASFPSGSTGGHQPLSVMQPFLAVYFCIALVGVFPSRN